MASSMITAAVLIPFSNLKKCSHVCWISWIFSDFGKPQSKFCKVVKNIHCRFFGMLFKISHLSYLGYFEWCQKRFTWYYLVVLNYFQWFSFSVRNKVDGSNLSSNLLRIWIEMSLTCLKPLIKSIIGHSPPTRHCGLQLLFSPLQLSLKFIKSFLYL